MRAVLHLSNIHSHADIPGVDKVVKRKASNDHPRPEKRVMTVCEFQLVAQTLVLELICDFSAPFLHAPSSTDDHVILNLLQEQTVAKPITPIFSSLIFFKADRISFLGQQDGER